MRKTLNKAIGILRQQQYAKLIKSAPKKYLISNVPYFSQWESPDLVESILTEKINAAEDPKWKSSGAKTRKEYALWSANACGMACTKMILANEIGKIVPIVKLGNESTVYGAYTKPLEESKGLIYRPFTKFLKAEYDLDSTLVLPLSINQIIYELSCNSYVIASVSPKIRHIDDTPPSKGGHLILVLGYDLDKNELYFHNPSGFIKETRQYAPISFRDFAKFFGDRGIVVKSSKLVH